MGWPIGGRVAVGDEEHPVQRDGLAGLDVEQLDLELGADLDAVLLPAGLDDCVHGSSEERWRPRGDRDMDMVKRPAAIAGANGECRADAPDRQRHRSMLLEGLCRRVAPARVAALAPSAPVIR